MNLIIFSLWPSYPNLQDSPTKLFCTFELPKKNGMEKLGVFRQRYRWRLVLKSKS